MVVRRNGAELLAHHLKDFAVGAAMTRQRARFGGLGVLAGLANQRAQFLAVTAGVLGDPLGGGVVVGNQPVTPDFGLVQHQVVGGRAGGFFTERFLDGIQHLGLELAHELADELHLAAFAFEIGDAFGIKNGVLELVGQVQPRQQVGAQFQQVGAQLLQFGALAFEVGAALLIGALELGFELEVALAALGDELTTHEIAFFEFS